jgi:hypothetical protein
MNKIIFFLLLSITANQAFAQSFSTLNELLGLSRKNPKELEKALLLKGFSYDGLEDERQKFSKLGEGLNYELNPRVLQYNFMSREYFLEYYAFMERSGYVITKSTVMSIDTDEEQNAQLFEKGKIRIFLYQSDMTEGSETYSILLYPFGNENSNSSSDNSNSGKESISFGNIYVALLSPRSAMANKPSSSNSIQQGLQGFAGMGATAGFEGGFSGIAGLNLINNRLPYFLDLGISLKIMGGLQPFSYESLGFPYDDYKYSSFAKVGGGGGPAVVLSPLRETDFRIIFYYDFLPSASLGGAITYDGEIPDYSQSMARKSGSFALIKAFGFSVKYQSVLLGIESSKYIDKGSYENKFGYTGNITTETFEAKLPVNQLIVKLAYCF